MNDRDLESLYQRANAQDEARPSPAVRNAILANAGRLAAECRPAAGENRGLAAQLARASERMRGWPMRTLGTLKARTQLQILASLAAAVLAAVLLVPMLRSFPPPAARVLSVPRSPAFTAEKLSQSPVPQAQAAPRPSALPTTAYPLGRGADEAPHAAATRSAPAATSDSVTDLSLPARSAAAARMQRPSPEAAGVAFALRAAATAGDNTRLMALLPGNARLLEARDSRGRTALMLATLYGRSETVATLLARGANPNAADADGHTPLERARENNDAAIIAALTRAGGR